MIACSHKVGFVPPQEVGVHEWDEAITAFVKKVEDFNVRGQRYEITHPGFVQEYKFCPYCAQSLDLGALGLLSYAQAIKGEESIIKKGFQNAKT